MASKTDVKVKLFKQDEDFYKLREECYRKGKLFEDTKFPLQDIPESTLNDVTVKWTFKRPSVSLRIYNFFDRFVGLCQILLVKSQIFLLNAFRRLLTNLLYSLKGFLETTLPRE